MAVPAPAVVLVPGLGLDDDAWDGIRLHLPVTSQVVRLPALGLKYPRGLAVRVEDQAQRLLRHPGVAGAGPVVLVGHSASCSVVVEAALRSTDVVGLVLLGPVDPRATGWPRMAQQWLRSARHERPREVPRLLPQYLRTGLRSVFAGMDAMRAYRTDEAATRLRLPVVVVRGERDRISQAPWCEELAAAPGRRLDTVDRAGHMVNITHPWVVAAAVMDVVAVVAGTVHGLDPGTGPATGRRDGPPDGTRGATRSG